MERKREQTLICLESPHCAVFSESDLREKSHRYGVGAAPLSHDGLPNAVYRESSGGAQCEGERSKVSKSRQACIAELRKQPACDSPPAPFRDKYEYFVQILFLFSSQKRISQSLKLIRPIGNGGGGISGCPAHRWLTDRDVWRRLQSARHHPQKHSRRG